MSGKKSAATAVTIAFIFAASAIAWLSWLCYDAYRPLNEPTASNSTAPVQTESGQTASSQNRISESKQEITPAIVGYGDYFLYTEMNNMTNINWPCLSYAEAEPRIFVLLQREGHGDEVLTFGGVSTKYHMMLKFIDDRLHAIVLVAGFLDEGKDLVLVSNHVEGIKRALIDKYGSANIAKNERTSTSCRFAIQDERAREVSVRQDSYNVWIVYSTMEYRTQRDANLSTEESRSSERL